MYIFGQGGFPVGQGTSGTGKPVTTGTNQHRGQEQRMFSSQVS